MRPSRVFLPLLLSLPLTLSAQEAELSPALRAKLLAQNTVPPPATTPAGAPAAVPAATTETPAAPVPAIPGAVPAPGTVPTPGAVPPVPRPTIPRPGGIPLPGGNRIPRAGGPTAVPTGTTIPAPPAAAPAADSGNPLENIAFTDADITEVIDKYMEITRRHVLRPPELAGKVNLVANPNPLRPFTEEEAAEFIKAGLALQGFTIQRYNETTDKVLMLTPGAAPPLLNGLKVGEPIYTRAEDLPEDDIIVNFVLTLKHLPALETSQILAAAVPVRQFTKYIPVATSNSIFIQEYTSNIRTLLRVAKSLDLPPIKMIHEWVELERASAEDVQAILDQILQAQSQGRSGSGAQGGIRTISPAAAAANLANPGAPVPVSTGGAGASSGVMPDGSQVIVKADPRTNRVFLNGPEEHVKFLRTLIREFDEPSRVKNLLTQQLRYIPVNDFFGLATAALEATGAGQAGSGSTGGGGGGGASRTGGRTTGGDTGSGGGDFRSNFASRSTGGQAGTSQLGGGGGTGGTGGRSSRTGGGGASSTGGQFEAPQAQTIGKTLLISDPRTNSLIVSGPPDSIQRVSDLVKEMDRRPFQVHINAVIAQMAIGDDMSSNVDLLRKVTTVTIGGRAVDTSGFWRTGSTGSFIDPSALTETTLGTLSGLNWFAAAEGLFNAYVKLLETSNRSKLLAKPHITVANNEVGSISSGRRVPIPSNSQSSIVGNGTNTVTSNVEYENVVLSLNVTPLINSRNEITLTVEQLNDVIDGSQNISGNDIPIIATQELLTKVTIPNGAILVLGGLIQEGDSKTNSGIPFISKIPLLKYLVGSNSKKKERRELVVLLQARIIENADDMVDVNVSEIQRTVIGPEAERFAKPDRNTDNVRLPTFEADVPFNGGTAPLEPPLPQRSNGRARK